jgi:hypothetical protein
MRRLAATSFVLVVVGCTSPGTRVSDLSAIVGVWETEAIGRTGSDELTPLCRGTVEYRSDGSFLTLNGEMVITGHYGLFVRDCETYYREWDMRGNGKKSCQGFTSDFIIEHSKPERRIVIEGKVMKRYMSPPSTNYFMSVRVRNQ